MRVCLLISALVYMTYFVVHCAPIPEDVPAEGQEVEIIGEEGQPVDSDGDGGNDPTGNDPEPEVKETGIEEAEADLDDQPGLSGAEGESDSGSDHDEHTETDEAGEANNGTDAGRDSHNYTQEDVVMPTEIEHNPEPSPSTTSSSDHYSTRSAGDETPPEPEITSTVDTYTESRVSSGEANQDVDMSSPLERAKVPHRGKHELVAEGLEGCLTESGDIGTCSGSIWEGEVDDEVTDEVKMGVALKYSLDGGKYLSWEGGKVSVSEGDGESSMWVVTGVETSAVFQIHPKNGTFQELAPNCLDSVSLEIQPCMTAKHWQYVDPPK